MNETKKLEEKGKGSELIHQDKLASMINFAIMGFVLITGYLDIAIIGLYERYLSNYINLSSESFGSIVLACTLLMTLHLMWGITCRVGIIDEMRDKRKLSKNQQLKEK